MGHKLFDLGLFLFLAAPAILRVPESAIVGAVILGIGVVLEFLDK